MKGVVNLKVDLLPEDLFRLKKLAKASRKSLKCVAEKLLSEGCLTSRSDCNILIFGAGVKQPANGGAEK